MANCGTMGELKALYKRKNSVHSKFVAISEFGGISGGGIAGYNCMFFMGRNFRFDYLDIIEKYKFQTLFSLNMQICKEGR